MQTKRNLNSFQIQNSGVKTALKPTNLHVKLAQTYGDLENTHFQSTLVTMLVANQFFCPPEHFAKLPLGFSCHWGSVS